MLQEVRAATAAAIDEPHFHCPCHVACRSPLRGDMADNSGVRASEPRLLDQVRQQIRLRHYSPRTEEAYVGWIRRFILYSGKRHPRDMGEPEVTRFLSSLAVRGVSASTQNQALSAILFLYEAVLGRRVEWMNGIVRAQRPARLPVVLSRDEVSLLLARLRGPVCGRGVRSPLDQLGAPPDRR